MTLEQTEKEIEEFEKVWSKILNNDPFLICLSAGVVRVAKVVWLERARREYDAGRD